jgi:hypothetical protein
MSERAAITPEEFFKRIHESIEEAAFCLSQTPHDRHEEWLQGFAERVRAQWRAAFHPVHSGDGDTIVEDAVNRVMARRDQLEISKDAVKGGGS